MFRLFKVLLIVLALTILAVLSYAYLGDLTPKQTEVSEPVELNDG